MRDDLPTLNKHLLIDLGLGVAVLEPFPGGDARGTRVDLEETDPSVVAPVAGVATEARTAAVAHPHVCLELLLLGLWVGLLKVGWGAGERAVVVDMVTKGWVRAISALLRKGLPQRQGNKNVVIMLGVHHRDEELEYSLSTAHHQDALLGQDVSEA